MQMASREVAAKQTTQVVCPCPTAAAALVRPWAYLTAVDRRRPHLLCLRPPFAARSMQPIANHPRRARPTQMSWSPEGALPAARFETSRPPSRTAIRSLWMAGDWTATAIPCSMESSARSGALAAEGIAAELGAGLRLAIAPVETTGLVSLLRRRGAPRRGFRAPRISTVRP
jgi:hypothetical protein